MRCAGLVSGVFRNTQMPLPWRRGSSARGFLGIPDTDVGRTRFGAMFRFHSHHNALDRIVRPAVGFGEGVEKPESG
jgi:hypothetical protein